MFVNPFNHPYFDTEHYKETRRITEKKLVSLGYNKRERNELHTKMQEEILHLLTIGECIYIKGIGLFCRKEQ